jgi:hypothetical protein
VAGDARLLIFRAAALAVWVACVVLVFVPMHGASSKTTPFQGGKPAQPKSAPARGI